MTALINWLWSLLPAIDWRSMVDRHGLPVVLSLVLIYEVAIPVRDEILASLRQQRANFQDLTKAKLDDSVSLAKLTLLYEERERRAGMARHEAVER